MIMVGEYTCHPPPDIALVQHPTSTFSPRRMCEESVIAILSASQRRADHESEQRARMALAPVLAPGLRGGPTSGTPPSPPPRPLVGRLYRGPALCRPGSRTPLSPLWSLA